jgi:hypothetical protein
LIATATKDCCAVTSATEEEANAVLAELSILVPDVVALLQVLNGKKNQFDAILLADSIVDSDVKSMRSKVSALITCLYNICPADLLATAQGYINTINDIFTTTYSVWGLS